MRKKPMEDFIQKIRVQNAVEKIGIH